MKIKAFVILIILLFLIPTVLSDTLRQGETYETSGKQLIVENIKSDVIKVNVDGVKNTIYVGEQKEINGINILVEEIFYTDEPGERTVNVVMSIAFYCGDDNCDTDHNETKENCCEDCGCNPGYTCQDEVCKTTAQIQKEQEAEEEKTRDKCDIDADCDDNDDYTEDICKSYPGKPKKCLNIPPICKTDIECDDQDPCTLDKCVNNDCSYANMPDYESCSKKQESQEEQETATETENQSEETPKEMIEIVKKEKSIISRIISFFFSLFK